MDLVWLKILLLTAMIIITFIAGMIPVRLLKILRKSAASASSTGKRRGFSLVLCLLTCFSGGVFFATCFLHLFPELNEHLNTMKEDYGLSVSYPLAELLSCLGFFLLFFVEEVFLLALPGLAHSHGPPTAHHTVQEHQEHHHDGHEAEHCCHEAAVEVVEIDDSTGRVNHATYVSDDESAKRSLLRSNGNPGHRLAAVGQCGTTAHGDCRKHSTRVLSLAEPEACETNCETVKEDPPILMKSQPHAHSHGIRSITFVLAISFHSIIEGLALGVQSDAAEVSALFISLMVHKVIVAFSVGLQLARTHAHALGWVGASILLFAAMSPIGGVIGMFVQSAQMDSQLKDYLILIFQGLAVGTFIYVTFFEVLLHERDNEHPNLLKLAFMLIGFALIGLLRLYDEHEHGHAHGGGHGHSHEAPAPTAISSTTPFF